MMMPDVGFPAELRLQGWNRKEVRCVHNHLSRGYHELLREPGQDVKAIGSVLGSRDTAVEDWSQHVLNNSCGEAVTF